MPETPSPPPENRNLMARFSRVQRAIALFLEYSNMSAARRRVQLKKTEVLTPGNEKQDTSKEPGE